MAASRQSELLILRTTVALLGKSAVEAVGKDYYRTSAFANDPHRTASDYREALENEFSGVISDIVFVVTDWSFERITLGAFRDVFAANDN